MLIKDEKNEYSYEKGQIITLYILYPILLFSILVFNEIIILDFCGLSTNTKLYIQEREKREMLNDITQDSSLTNDLEDSNDVSKVNSSMF